METACNETGQHAHGAMKNSERRRRRRLNARLNAPRSKLQRTTSRLTNRLGVRRHPEGMKHDNADLAAGTHSRHCGITFRQADARRPYCGLPADSGGGMAVPIHRGGRSHCSYRAVRTIHWRLSREYHALAKLIAYHTNTIDVKPCMLRCSALHASSPVGGLLSLSTMGRALRPFARQRPRTTSAA